MGTRSVLFGAHQFLIHPWFVALGWWRLYGFPLDPRLWVAFFVHDLGYIGKPNMDGDEGEEHPMFGALIMNRFFDSKRNPRWYQLCLYHSRFYAQKHGAEPSRLCYADKLAIVLTPWWLYRWTAGLTGEIEEYMSPALHAGGGKHESAQLAWTGEQSDWYLSVQEHLVKWVDEHAGATR